MSNEIESAAREVAAWFTSGNSVKVDMVQQVRRNKEAIQADVDRLNKALRKDHG